ncbi:MAG: class II fructose-bisphosphate aldolase [Bacteroidota bacterium]
MPVITIKEQALEVINHTRDKCVSLGVFCTASHWNTEAILMAASNFAKKHRIQRIPVAVAMTFNYPHMSQACRVTRCGRPELGFIAIMEYLKVLCDGDDSPYSNVIVLPHLDHADPVKDKWALTEGLPYLASVMFDAQTYSFEENIKLTKEYVKQYGREVLVEGIMDHLSVNGNSGSAGDDNYVEKALEYVESTKVDYLVADLGTEQQSRTVGESVYLKARARNLTTNLGRGMLVLHGTSCLNEAQMRGLADDGIVRVNMWTRIVREAGQYATDKMLNRIRNIYTGDFEAAESRQYLYDSIEKAADIMEGILDSLGYKNLAGLT